MDPLFNRRAGEPVILLGGVERATLATADGQIGVSASG